MSKSLAIFLTTLSILSLTGFGAVQYRNVKIAEETNKKLEFDKDRLEKSLSLADSEIGSLTDENIELKERIVILRDSIADFQRQIKSLKSKLYASSQASKKMEADMESLRKKYFDIQTEIENLKKSGDAKEEYISQLEVTQTQLQVENDSIYKTNVITQQELIQASDDLVALEMKQMRKQDLLEVLEFTNIYFDNITIKKAERGPSQKKIKKDGRAWNYTLIDLSLQHDNIHQLIDETFIVKIIDIDNDMELSFVESNPAFPESPIDHKGLSFQFDGMPLNLKFHNNEDKMGKNYALQLYYVQDGEEHRLKNGYKQFIVNGKILE